MLNILHVEDDLGQFRLVKEAFGGKSTIVHAASAELGLRSLLSNNTFDIVLLDLDLPGMTGLEFLKAVKTGNAFNHLKYIPIIIVTNSKDPENVISSFNNYAAGYILKPITFKGLEEAIKSLSDFYNKSQLVTKLNGP